MKANRAYKLSEVSVQDAFKKTVLPFSICFGATIFGIAKNRDIELLIIGGVLSGLVLVVFAKLIYEGNQVYLKTNQHGLNFTKSNIQYPWSSLKKLVPLRIQLHVMAAPYPGYLLHFDNGDERIIDQRLKGYTALYQELYQHKIPGAEKPLYLYEVDITGAKKDMRRQYHSVYYPDKDVVVKEKGIAIYEE